MYHDFKYILITINFIILIIHRNTQKNRETETETHRKRNVITYFIEQIHANVGTGKSETHRPDRVVGLKSR